MRRAAVTLVVDASVGLTWALEEPDGALAHALLVEDEPLLIPDFWLNEAANVRWVQVRRGKLTPAEARKALSVLRGYGTPEPPAELALHDLA